MNQYSPEILKHYRNPRNFGKLEKPTHAAEEVNPLCGDEIKIYLTIKDEIVRDMKYEARGCALSIATASVLSDAIMGKRVREIKKISKTQIEKLLKIKVNPARETCVALAQKAINKALHLNQGEKL